MRSSLNRSANGDVVPAQAVAGVSANRVVRKRGRGDEPQSPVAEAPKPSVTVVPLVAPVSWVGPRIGVAHYAAAQFGGRVYHVNDTVLLQSNTATPYVCRIERMLERDGAKVMFVRWFFRPLDVHELVSHLQRQPYAEEVFMTDVVEENDITTILHRCYILTPHKLSRLPMHLREPNVFCCTLFYDSVRERFSPVQSISRAGLFLSDPPPRAPRLNMPELQPGTVGYGVGVPGGPGRGGARRKRKDASEAANDDDAFVCCVEDCDNVCWTKRHKSSLLCEWNLKPGAGAAYVCSEHHHADKRCAESSLKVRASVTSFRLLSHMPTAFALPFCVAHP